MFWAASFITSRNRNVLSIWGIHHFGLNFKNQNVYAHIFKQPKHPSCSWDPNFMNIIADKESLLSFSSWKVTTGVTWQKWLGTSKNENYFPLLLPRLFKMDSNKEWTIIYMEAIFQWPEKRLLVGSDKGRSSAREAGLGSSCNFCDSLLLEYTEPSSPWNILLMPQC